MKSLFKYVLGVIFRRFDVYAILKTHGLYLYVNNATVFPSYNLPLLKIARKMDLHDAFFNIWDEITIEENVIFGHEVMFLTGKHEVDEAGAKKEAASRGKILVKKNAWIGSRAIILGGVAIGEGSVVGAGSTITKDVPDHEFWAGNPAKFIKSLSMENSSAKDRVALHN